MIYSVTISDNDFWFLMNECMNYVSKWYDSYKSDYDKCDFENTIKDLITEYLNGVHVDSKIKDYVLNRIKIKKVDAFVPHNENSEMYYFFGNTWVHQ